MTDIKTKRDLRYIEHGIERVKAELANAIAEEFRYYGTQCPEHLAGLTNDEDVWNYSHDNSYACHLVENEEGVQLEWEGDYADSLTYGFLQDLMQIAEHMFNQRESDDNDLACEWDLADKFMRRSQQRLVEFIEKKMDGRNVRRLPVYNKWCSDDTWYDRFCGLTTNNEYRWTLVHKDGKVMCRWYDADDSEDDGFDNLNDIYLEELLWIARNV